MKEEVNDGQRERQYEQHQDLPAPRRCRDDGSGGKMGRRRVPIRQWAAAVDYRGGVEEEWEEEEVNDVFFGNKSYINLS